MNERLPRALDNIRSDTGVTRLDEASVRQVVVLQILTALGWNQFNQGEVTPEFTVGEGRVDYSLQIGGQSKVFIEVKRGGEVLLPHQDQLLRYSFERGISLAALTNGLEWWFYLPLREGSWEERRFSAVNVVSDDGDSVEAVLLNVLSKDRVASGASLEYGENLLERRRRERIINENLPKAWDSLVSEPDELLVDLLAERVERISKISPHSSVVRSFILDRVARASDTPFAEPIVQVQRISTHLPHNVSRVEPVDQPSRVRTTPTPTKRRNHPKRFTGFRFQGESFQVSQWYGLLQMLSEIIYRRHPTEFDRVLELRGDKNAYYSMNRENLTDRAKPIGNSGYYVETKFGADNTVKQCHKLLRKFGYREQDIEIDYA